MLPYPTDVQHPVAQQTQENFDVRVWQHLALQTHAPTLATAGYSYTNDVTPPDITVVGSNPATIYKGGTYVDAGATALDDRDGDITKNIVVTNSVNTLVLGTYLVLYSVHDTWDNAGYATRTVEVVAEPPATTGGNTPPPVVPLKPDSPPPVSPPPVVAPGSGNQPPGSSASNNADISNIPESPQGPQNSPPAPTPSGGDTAGKGESDVFKPVTSLTALFSAMDAGRQAVSHTISTARGWAKNTIATGDTRVVSIAAVTVATIALGVLSAINFFVGHAIVFYPTLFAGVSAAGFFGFRYYRIRFPRPVPPPEVPDSEKGTFT